MHPVLSPFSLLPRPPALRCSTLGLHQPQPHLNICPLYLPFLPSLRTPPFSSSRLSRNLQSFVGAAVTSSEGEAPTSVIEFEEITERDWSFLESEGTNFDRILSAGQIREDSRVLVSLGSEGFVDRAVENSSPCQLLLVVHDSLFVLAGIKEMYDAVKCWQGELIYVPSKWAPFDVVFLYFFPALSFKLDEIFRALSSQCLPGARIVISHPQGREVLEQQRQQNPDVIVSDLPDKITLQNVAAGHSFRMVEFVDEPGLYLAVLKFMADNSDE